MKKHKFLKKADIILVLIILAFVILWGVFIKSNDPCEALIFVDGKEYMRIDLEKQEKDEIIKIGNASVFISGQGTVRITDSDCSDKVCVSSGEISEPGSVIACVPNRIVIEVRKNNSYVDGVTG